MLSSSEPPAAVGVRQRRSSSIIWVEVALGERLHLRPVDGDVVVELRVGPDDRVHLADRAAGVGLQVLDVGRLARRGGPTTIAAAPSPKIIRDGRTLPILSENFSAQTTSTGRFTSWRRRTASTSPYGKPGAGGDEVVGAVRLVDPELPGEPGGRRTGSAVVLVHVQTRPPRSPPARARRPRAPPGPPAGEISSRRRSRVEPLLDPGLLADLVGGHRRPVVGRVADQVLVGAERARRSRRPAPRGGA